jgi:hypothetical protein
MSMAHVISVTGVTTSVNFSFSFQTFLQFLLCPGAVSAWEGDDAFGAGLERQDCDPTSVSSSLGLQ